MCMWCFFFCSIRFTKKIPIKRHTLYKRSAPAVLARLRFFFLESFYTIYRSIFKRRCANKTTTYCRRLAHANGRVHSIPDISNPGIPRSKRSFIPWTFRPCTRVLWNGRELSAPLRTRRRPHSWKSRGHVLELKVLARLKI